MAVNQPKALGKQGKNKDFTIRLQSRKELSIISKFSRYFAEDLKNKARWRLL